MSEVNIPPFYPGQKIIRTGPTNKFVTKGHIYTCIECTACSCGYWLVTINVRPIVPLNISSCGNCRAHLKSRMDYMGGDARNFAPVQENFQSITLEKVLEQETKLVGVN